MLINFESNFIEIVKEAKLEYEVNLNNMKREFLSSKELLVDLHHNTFSLSKRAKINSKIAEINFIESKLADIPSLVGEFSIQLYKNTLNNKLNLPLKISPETNYIYSLFKLNNAGYSTDLLLNMNKDTILKLGHLDHNYLQQSLPKVNSAAASLNIKKDNYDIKAQLFNNMLMEKGPTTKGGYRVQQLKNKWNRAATISSHQLDSMGKSLSWSSSGSNSPTRSPTKKSPSKHR